MRAGLSWAVISGLLWKSSELRERALGGIAHAGIGIVAAGEFLERLRGLAVTRGGEKIGQGALHERVLLPWQRGEPTGADDILVGVRVERLERAQADVGARI